MICIINFKAYKESSGVRAVKLARICDKVAQKENANIALAVQPADILAVACNANIPVIAQHVDSIQPGKHTGFILPESVHDNGAVGSLVNHSEHRLPLEKIKDTINRLRKLRMISVACANTTSKAAEISRFKPDIIAIEPPELIGTKVSVSEAKPNIITNSVKKSSRPVICGAGIHRKEDVEKAVELGAQGILVASGVVKARNPSKVLTQLVRGLS